MFSSDKGQSGGNLPLEQKWQIQTHNHHTHLNHQFLFFIQLSYWWYRLKKLKNTYTFIGSKCVGALMDRQVWILSLPDISSTVSFRISFSGKLNSQPRVRMMAVCIILEYIVIHTSQVQLLGSQGCLQANPFQWATVWAGSHIQRNSDMQSGQRSVCRLIWSRSIDVQRMACRNKLRGAWIGVDTQLEMW